MATASEFLIDRLIEWDLHRWYGFPGDGIGGFDGFDGFDGALARAERAGKDFRYLRSVHIMNGLYDAKCDNQPVVAIVGQQARVAEGSDFQQELNMERKAAMLVGQGALGGADRCPLRRDHRGGRATRGRGHHRSARRGGGARRRALPHTAPGPWPASSLPGSTTRRTPA